MIGLALGPHGHTATHTCAPLTPDIAAVTPYMAIGSVEEIAAHFVAGHERWGITTYVVRCPTQEKIDAFAPVLAALP